MVWIPAFAGMTGVRGNIGEWKRAELRRLLSAVENRAGDAIGDAAVSRFGFVKKARVDFQTSLGGRKGQFAIDAVGGLRERGDDVIGWHLRGYAGEEKARGGNVGLFWRFIKVNSLFGANAFLDYERDENAGGFWRWSFGAEWKNKYGELSANSYWRITDGKQQADGFYYTREGFDADLYLRAPGLEWAALRGGYYQWKGERGDGDDEGFRYGLRLSPGGGVFVEAEFDEESGDFGGSFSYSHTFGEASAGAEKAGDFNPRLHFYDSARREYSQRISRAGGGVSQFAAVLVTSDLDVNIGVAGFTATAFSRTMTARINYDFPLTSDVNITTGASGNEAFFRQQAGGWNLTLNANSTVAILQTARVLSVSGGGGEFERFGNNRLATVIMPGVTLRLLGTRFSWDVGGGGATMTLHEGTVSVVGASAPFTISTVGNARAMLADLGIAFASPGSFVFLTTGDNATVGNIAASGGYGTRTTAILGSPSGGFNLNANGFLFFTDAGNAATFTVTVTANDSHDNTDAVSLFVTVSLVTGFAMPPPHSDILTVTTHTDYNPLAQFAAGGGTDIRYGLLNAPASPTFAINADDGELRFASNPHLPIMVSVTATASGQPPVGQRQTATVALTLAIVNPPQLTIGFDGAPTLSFLTVAGAKTVGNIAISGGDNRNTLAFAGAANGFSFFNDTVLIVANAANAGRFTTTVRASNPHSNVADKFLTASVTVAAPITADISGDSYTVFLTQFLGTVGTVSISGGELRSGENYQINASPAGNFMISQNTVLFTANSTGTITATITADDALDATAPATLLLTFHAIGVCSFNADLCRPISDNNWSGNIVNHPPMTSPAQMRAMLAAGFDTNGIIAAGARPLDIVNFSNGSGGSVNSEVYSLIQANGRCSTYCRIGNTHLNGDVCTIDTNTAGADCRP